MIQLPLIDVGHGLEGAAELVVVVIDIGETKVVDNAENAPDDAEIAPDEVFCSEGLPMWNIGSSSCIVGAEVVVGNDWSPVGCCCSSSRSWRG